MSDQDYQKTVIIQHYRARVEHTNHVFKCHCAFQTPWRCSVKLLSAITRITAHTTNIQLHLKLN